MRGDGQCAKGFRVGWREGEAAKKKKRASAMRKKEILPFMITWLDLENIMLNEINQREKDKDCRVSLICVIEKTELVKTESRLVVTRGLREGE